MPVIGRVGVVLVVLGMVACGSSPTGHGAEVVAVRVENVYRADNPCHDQGPPRWTLIRDPETSTEQVDAEGDGRPELVRTDGDRVAFRSALLPGLRSTWTTIDTGTAPTRLVNLVASTRPGLLAPSFFGVGDPIAAFEKVQDLEDDGETSPVDGSDVGLGPGRYAWEAVGGVVQSVVVTASPADSADLVGLDELRLERIEVAEVGRVETVPLVSVETQPVAPFLVTSSFADGTCRDEASAEAYAACIRDVAGDMTVDEWLSAHPEDILGEEACRGR